MKTIFIILISLAALHAAPILPVVAQAASVEQATGYQGRLLEIAFDAVSKMPTDPHRRNRALAREKIIAACLEIDEPERAVSYADQIGTWRRGTAYADIALQYARKGDKASAARELAKAEQLLRNSEAIRDGDVIATGDFKGLAESMQEWRLDRVKAHISRTYIFMEQADSAAQWSAGLGEDEAPKVSALEASICSEQEYGRVKEELFRLAETEQFEAVKNALLGLCDLYGRFYKDTEKRVELEEAISRYRSEMPRFMQIEILANMAGSAIDNDDFSVGLSLVAEANSKLEGASYRPRLYFPMKSTLVSLMFRGGSTALAVEQLDSMVSLYDSKRNDVIDIYRAAILCRIGEASAVVGKRDQSRKLYEQAAAEAIVNANSRPRADDLSTICCSMAIHEVEPTGALFQTLENISNGLGEPW